MHEKDARRGVGFNRAAYAFLRIIGGRAFMSIIGCKYEKKKIRSKTFLLLGNHVDAIDPVKAVVMTGRHMKFVASTNVLKGLRGLCLKVIAGPIPRKKGESAENVTRAIIQNLNAGVSVGMFPEGKRSLDGQTGFISRRTADILKEAECGLVTVVYEAAPLKKPRWGHKRDGNSYARVVAEYDAESLRTMTADEIYDIICRDLYTDCYAWQKEHRVVYPCREGRAEGIEKILIKCPECSAICSFVSSGSAFSCSACGVAYTLDEYDLICPADGDKNAKFDSITEWNRWQKKTLYEERDLLSSMTDKPIFCQDNVALYASSEKGENTVYESAELFFYGDRLEIKCENDKMSFAMNDIQSLGGFGSSNIMFTYNGTRYRLYAKKQLYEYRYFALWKVLQGKILY